ncbi:endonuclease III [Candidatus Roizmanbacteria bacterium CG_4_10_14_3_um_filter_39_13]|uniref:Endonuclease III n=1 Tax=Candidatus Roizmanbacteria bacterium CG_4_10_14_3_um_filter_39_13 TaxID=1974831 RepID=A0A2M7LKW0_9BACT|nr:MAG: endonuclease III [Candidatus Roizmanbacteria bacterium CG_4_10_14_3_um_filter_39_13]
MKNEEFIKTVWEYYKKNKRAMPWREDISPYSIFISEVMLQQTQVARVLAAYPLFKSQFPSFKSLSQVHTATLLAAWQGMGYNRRALYLKAAAEVVCTKYKEVLPEDTALLDKLPGIGHATACSIVAFAFNKPVVFIETNIRRVFIYYFFSDTEDVSDNDILPLVEKTLDKKNPREWYWGLMDYGAYLATQIENPNIKSKHYVKQKKFEGSVRQVRGAILKYLLKRSYSKEELEKIYTDDERLFTALEQLEKEGFIASKKGRYNIK